MRKAPIVSHWLPAHRLPTAVAAFLFVSLAACANWPARDDTPDTGALLRNSLPVAAAALAAGQLNVARRLYISLSERFDSVPEPLLGLGYIALQSGDSAVAENYFRQAAERATDAPALQAEALLGAGRAALVQGKTERARRHFRNARTPGKGTPLAAWIANGLAVASALESDYEAAGTHYDDARRLSPGSPRIAANFIRTLVAAGRIDDAARAYAQHPPSYWPDDDGAALSRLIEDARLQRRIEALARPRVKTDAMATDESQVPGDATPEPAGHDAPPPALDPDLAMRVYLSDMLSGKTGEDAGFSRASALPRESALVLHLDDWPDPSTPPATDAGTTTSSAAGAISPASPASFARSPGAAGAGIATQPTPSRRPTRTDRRGSRLPGARAGAVASRFRRDRLRTCRSRTLRIVPCAAGRRGAPSAARGDRRSCRRVAGSFLAGHIDPHGGAEPAAAPRTRRGHRPGRRAGSRGRAVALARRALRPRQGGRTHHRGGARRRAASRRAGRRGGAGSGAAAHDSGLRARPARCARATSVARDGPDRRRSVGRVCRSARCGSPPARCPKDTPIENELRISGAQQVNLEVQIAEVQRSVTEDLGSQLGGVPSSRRGDRIFGFRIGRLLPSIGDPDPQLPLGALPTGLSVRPFRRDEISPTSMFFGRRTPQIPRLPAMIDALATGGSGQRACAAQRYRDLRRGGVLLLRRRISVADRVRGQYGNDHL